MESKNAEILGATTSFNEKPIICQNHQVYSNLTTFKQFLCKGMVRKSFKINGKLSENMSISPFFELPPSNKLLKYNNSSISSLLDICTEKSAGANTPAFELYRDYPNSTVFAHQGNRTIEKTVLFGDCFSTKIRIYDFWNFKVPFFLLIMYTKLLIFSM